jgi:disulfide oxidoreductase YuzD
MPEKTVQFPSIKDVPTSKWENLAQKKIYFGHQSVGFNIIDGIKDVMKDHPQIKLNIVETANQSDFKVGLFAHSRVGKNVNPKSKTDEFVEFINKGIGGKADAAALKFCYVDITAGTNANNVFNDYSDSISQLKTKYPDMIIIHFTTPLTQRQTGIKASIKKLIGRPIGGVADNIKRNEYNEMLLKRYEGKEPILDIAKIESTYPDGTRETFSQDGKTYYSMVPEYTYDGGHLNETGRKKVAEQLLILLANLN